MFCRELYCCVCGCPFTKVELRDPENPDPNESPLLQYGDPYDARNLSAEDTLWLTQLRIISQAPALLRVGSDLRDMASANISTDLGVFISTIAEWRYRDTLRPKIYSSDRTEEFDVTMYEQNHLDDRMFFPIHVCCLRLMEVFCDYRQQRLGGSAPTAKLPSDLRGFCHALTRQRENNVVSTPSRDYYYGSSGGLEWEHEYLGARQFWGDGWETEPGWEWLCADPFNIHDLSAFIPTLSTGFSKSSNIQDDTYSQARPSSTLRNIPQEPTRISMLPPEILSLIFAYLPNRSILALDRSSKKLHARVSAQLTNHFWLARVTQETDVLGWLSPWERTEIESEAEIDWKEVLKLMGKGPHQIKADGGAMVGGITLPISLKNRWRIWKILDSIRMDGEEI